MTTRPTGPPARRATRVTETARLAPLGTAHRGVAVWAVPGREPGQIRNLRHLTWSGPGDYVHLCYGGIADGDTEYPGEDMGRVSGRRPTFEQAQAAVDAYVSGRRI
jgi:hypothetical protein